MPHPTDEHENYPKPPFSKSAEGERYGEADAYKKGKGGPPESEQGYYQALTLRALKDLEQGGLSAKLDRIEAAILHERKAEIAKLYEGTTVFGQQIKEIADGMTGDEVKPQATMLKGLASNLIALGKPVPTEAQGLEAKIDQLTNAFRKELSAMSAQLDTLKAEVTKNTTVTQSAITLLDGLAAQILALKEDPVALTALAEEVKATHTAMAAAVTKNTSTPPNG